MTTPAKPPSVAVLGAGLGGTLIAIYLARRGFDVSVFERRPDLRKGTVEQGRSINMTPSLRNGPRKARSACSARSKTWCAAGAPAASA